MTKLPRMSAPSCSHRSRRTNCGAPAADAGGAAAAAADAEAEAGALPEVAAAAVEATAAGRTVLRAGSQRGKAAEQICRRIRWPVHVHVQRE